MKFNAIFVAGFSLVLLGVGRTVSAQSTLPNMPIPNVRTGASSVPAPNGVSALPSARSQQGGGSPQFLSATEASIDQQTRGQFPTMDRSPSLPLGTLQRSWDRPSAASGQVAPGVIHYMWHPDFIMSVRTRDFMVTTLLLPQWERANEFYVGDPVVFEAKKIRPNVIAVRSRNAGADSNLTVLGASGNIYNFYLRSETWNSTQVSDLTVYVDAARNADDADGLGGGAAVGATSSMDGPSAIGPSNGSIGSGAVAGMPDYLRRIVFRPEDLRFDMKMYARNEADADIAPERIFEDGIFTYFDFGDRSDSIARPVVHQLVDGVDTVINTRTAGPRGNVLIAEAVGDFSLRNGARVVCVRRASVKQTATPIEIGGSLPEAGAK